MQHHQSLHCIFSGLEAIPSTFSSLKGCHLWYISQIICLFLTASINLSRSIRILLLLTATLIDLCCTCPSRLRKFSLVKLTVPSYRHIHFSFYPSLFWCVPIFAFSSQLINVWTCFLIANILMHSGFVAIL